MCFKPKSIKFVRPVFYLNHTIIPHVSTCKYLGITISDGTCDVDLKRQLRKFYANANLLLRKFSHCSSDVKCYLFKTYCSNMYCSMLWFDATKTAMKNVKIAYNNSLRRLLGVPRYFSASEMFVSLNIPSFGELLRKYIFSFINRIMTSNNSYILNIYTSTVTLHSNVWAWWQSILFK